MADFPEPLRDTPWGRRLRVAVDAVHSAGTALMALRGLQVQAAEIGSQLKTSVDVAAEGWVVGLLQGTFQGDQFLAEEAHASTGRWDVVGQPFWTVDALDGTRSYVEGYAGFCVQVAYVDGGRPRFGVVAEPVTRRCFIGAEGRGAWELDARGDFRLLATRQLSGWPEHPRFVDSTPPGGSVGQILAQRAGRFVECGSVGLKACRVVAGEADVYAKAFRFRLWDVAPAQVLLTETACSLRLWSGQHIDYSGKEIEFENLVAAPDALLESVLEGLALP